MGHIKIISLLLIYFIIKAACSTTISPPKEQTAKKRIDSYEEILRPPPPPPPLRGSVRVQHSSPGQRFQRQQNPPNIFPLSQQAFGSSPFHPDRYPQFTVKTNEPSFMQKISGWFFAKEPENVQQPSFGPPPTFLVPSTQPIAHQHSQPPPQNPHVPPQKPHAPQTRLNYPRQIQKNCNPCNYVPWVPLYRLQNSVPHQNIHQVNINFLSPAAAHAPNGYHNGGSAHETLSPSKLSLPSQEQHSHYLTQHSNKIETNIGSPPRATASPLSLSQVQLNDNFPKAGPGFSTPLKNSYGTPIPPNAYDSPYPETNDHDVISLGHRVIGNNYEHQAEPPSKFSNGDNFQHLDSNDAPLLTKPTDDGLIHGFRKNKGKNFSSSNNDLSSPELHNDDPFVRPVYRLQNFNRGHILQPIPLPNLSPVPIPPIFNSRPFKTKHNRYPVTTLRPYTFEPVSTERPFTPSNEYPKYTSTENFKLIPSIPIAEFTSMVEYPISIVQSPLLEIDSTQNQHQHQHHDHQEESSQDSFEFNPIIVESSNKNAQDSYSAASGGSDHDSEPTAQTVKEENKYHTPTIDYTKSTIRFLPTPNTFETDSNDNEDIRRPSFSYSYIDQTFYSKPNTTTKPITYNPIFTQPEETSERIPFRSVDPQTLQSLDFYLKPNTPLKDSDNFKKNLYDSTTQEVNHNTASSNTISSTSRPIISSTLQPLSSNALRFIDNRVVPGRWPPPVTDSNGQGVTTPTKKPKRIQIIIPYTSQNQPSPFKFSNNNVASATGWVPMIDELGTNSGRKVPSPDWNQNSVNGLHSTNTLVDYHESSESKIITSSTPSFNKTINFIKKTYTSTPSVGFTTNPDVSTNESKTSFDIKKLQKNIDDWTAQEYSKIYRRQQKSSTVSHLKRSKKIPDEYFTTVTPVQRKVSKSSNSFLSTINDLNASFLDNEAAGSIQHSVETDLNDEKLIENFNNEIYDENTAAYTVQTTYYTTTPIPTTTPYVETTTFIPKTTTRHSWDKIQTSISPLTREKIYVVTPIPKFNDASRREISNDTSSNTIVREDVNNLTFKSPRFLVRPTPGPTGSQREHSTISPGKPDNIPISGFDWLRSINHLAETTTTESASNSLFGLSAVTSFTPQSGSSVHTITGHSKVVTGVTASSVPQTTSG